MTSERATVSYGSGYDERRSPNALYLWRHVRRWTQGELARRSGLTQETISRIERGHERPRPTTRARLAEALEIEEEHLFVSEESE